LDILHVHYAIPHAISGYLAKEILKEEKNVQLVTTLHGTDITLVGRDKTYAPVVTFSINKSDAITAVSDNLRKETLENFDIKKDISVIHNFVDINRFSVKAMDAFKKAIAPNGEKVILHASNFRKVKRIADVIYTFNKIKKSIPSKLLLVGDGPERHMAEELCRELGIFEETRFVGKQQDMEDIYAIADLFLLPSEYESFGLAALEAMATGTPVVATNAGGIPEIITHGKNGFLCDIGDVEQMSSYAISILENDKILEAFSLEARKQAERFDIHKIVPQYELLYDQVLRK